MKLAIKNDDPEEVLYLELQDDDLAIDLVGHLPGGALVYIVGIRKATGELIRYGGHEIGAGIAVKDGMIREEAAE